MLLWQNDAAPLFLAKLKKHGLKLAPPAVPIKGQIARNIRLGSVERTSLARIQFLAGEKPASGTCATTPLIWQDGQTVLLVVGVDPIAPDVLAAARDEAEPVDQAVAPAPVDEAPALPAPLEDTLPEESIVLESTAESAPPATADAEADETSPGQDDIEAAREALDEAEHPDARDDGIGRTIIADETRYAQELENWRSAEPDGAARLGLVREATDAPAVEGPEDTSLPEPVEPSVVHEPEGADQAPHEEATPSRLSRLVDRLAADDALFTPLTEADDAPPATPEAEATAPNEVDEPVDDQDVIVPDADEPTTEEPELSDTAAEDVADLTLLDGVDNETAAIAEADGAEDAEQRDVRHMAEALSDVVNKPVADPEVVERVSRYNFDELARILTDRVGEPAAAVVNPVVPTDSTRGGALINLGGETLVLNRLPLGIMVFRDQQVLFANRAITEMIGYPSVESLRAAGLAAVFPATGPDGEAGAGPVNHLVQRDGTLVPVTARLQSISWQGKPALMLSASTTEVRTGHEAAVAAFARTFADLRGDGFFEATRAGVISAITPRSAALLGAEGMLEGKPLSALVAEGDVGELREFFERPARFAETARPALTLRSANGAAEIALFAQGQAGVLTGYFGFVHRREPAPIRLAAPADADPALLARISRGVRRPLNTIIGFADMIRSEAFGALQNERYGTYAEDITTAGQEIAALVDELDDYARLRDGRYLPQRASIDLTSLLESCVLRIRQQASGARVIVRNAISESLPRVTADRASLAQAVLNLLASAIDQTPSGGGVVISAQREDDGGISVHVRDSSTTPVDLAERFVVFRDGTGRNGQMMVPVRSSIGLALTRSLLAVNAFSLSVDPAGEQGMLFTMIIPADLVEPPATPQTPG